MTKKIIICIITITIIFFYKIDYYKTFKIEKIQIDNQLKYITSEQINEKMSVFLNKSFFKCNIDAINDSIMSIPMAKQANIKRQWPNTIVVNIIEYEPIAIWGDNHVVSKDKHILFAKLSEELTIGMPKFIGTKTRLNDMLQVYDDLNKTLNDLNLNVKELDARLFYAWQVVLNNNLTLKLNSENYKMAVQRFKNLYPKHIDKSLSKIAYVDARYSNGIAIGKR